MNPIVVNYKGVFVLGKMICLFEVNHRLVLPACILYIILIFVLSLVSTTVLGLVVQTPGFSCIFIPSFSFLDFSLIHLVPKYQGVFVCFRIK